MLTHIQIRDFAIIGTSLEGRITFWNEGASRVLGWSEAELVGRTPPFPYWPEEDREMLLARTSERQGRLIDTDESASMEKKKQEGYF